MKPCFKSLFLLLAVALSLICFAFPADAALMAQFEAVIDGESFVSDSLTGLIPSPCANAAEDCSVNPCCDNPGNPLHCDAGLYPDEAYYKDLSIQLAKRCCPAQTFWDNDEGACVPIVEAITCYPGSVFTEDFDTLDVSSRWYRFFYWMQFYNTGISALDELEISGLKDFPEYVPAPPSVFNYGVGADYLAGRYKFCSDDADPELLVFNWSMRLAVPADSTAMAYFLDDTYQSGVGVWRTGNFYKDNQPHKIIVMEIAKTTFGFGSENADVVCDEDCCIGCIFRELQEFDDFSFVFDVENQRYKVLVNGKALTFEGSEWKNYVGFNELEDVNVLFGGNSHFESAADARFDDFSVNGGSPDCDDLEGYRICSGTNLNPPADAPPCNTDESDRACIAEPGYCVYGGNWFYESDPTASPYPLGYDATTAEVTTDEGIPMTCHANITGGIINNGVWCPQFFMFDSDLQKCVPAFSGCDEGYIPEDDAPDQVLDCYEWWNNPEGGSPDYIVGCVQTDPNPWEEACCYSYDYRDYNIYDWYPVEVYNPS